MNYKQIYAIQANNKKRILKVVPEVSNNSGIYIFVREDNGIKYAYIGQAKHLLDRLASHLSGYQHIDISLKKHGISNENVEKWNIIYKEFEIENLDTKEQEYILEYAASGYQLYNHTTGSQGKGKKGMKETQRKGYYQGFDAGYLKARKEIANMFDKHLSYSVKKEGNKNQEKALMKFEKFIKGDE